MIYDSIIIGAGAAGLSMAALLNKKGESIALLEQHYLLGGCAGYYTRPGKFTFNVGATTLSGFKKDQAMGRLIQDLDLKLELHQEDVAQTLYIGDKTINRYRNLDKWISELEKHFPGAEHRVFWEKLKAFSDFSWTLANASHAFPPQSIKDVITLLKANLKKPIFAMQFARFLKSIVPKSYKENPELIRLLNEQLLISTQTDLTDVGLLIGAVGLIYPEDMAYPLGGMKSLVTAIKQTLPKESIFLRQNVLKILKENDIWIITTDKGSFQAKKVISTISHWNLLEKIASPKLKNLDKKFPPQWSALAAYFALETNQPLQSRYHQIHDDLGSLFFSFSKEGDGASPTGHLSATVSTHLDIENYKKSDLAEVEIKEYFEQRVRTALLRIFSKQDISQIKIFEPATPKTFEKFTKRKDGCVGGVPHIGNISFINYPKNEIGLIGFYRIGDTVFPGQGIVGVIQGAYNCLKKINDHHN